MSDEVPTVLEVAALLKVADKTVYTMARWPRKRFAANTATRAFVVPRSMPMTCWGTSGFGGGAIAASSGRLGRRPASSLRRGSLSIDAACIRQWFPLELLAEDGTLC